MERLLRRPLVIILRGIIVLGLAGCANQQMSASNPFMAPDRVPPPATRTIAPGTAAPYYPGDPVPAAQVAPATAAVVVQAPQTAGPRSPTAAAPVSTPSASQPLAFTNERNVAIPTDSENLRFAVPTPPNVEQPQTLTAAPEVSAPPTQPVVPAAFNQPIASQPAPADLPIPTASTDDSSGPWRSPQLPSSNSPVMQAEYVQPQTTAPTTLVAAAPQSPPTAAVQQMPVELRPVAPPAGATTIAAAPNATASMQTAPMQTSPPPRMRFPNWTEPSTWFTPQPAPAANQQLVGYMVPGPNGTQQMISVEQYQAMVNGAASSAASVATSDGFRPRGTTTK